MEGIDTKAAAPTGIAAANVEIEGTQVSATTVHNLFDFNNERVSQLDFSKVTQAKVAALIQVRVLLLDEVSMLDYVCFNSICKVLSDIDHCRRPDATVESDTFGSVHMVLFGDLKQLPPASSHHRPPDCSELRLSRLAAEQASCKRCTATAGVGSIPQGAH